MTYKRNEIEVILTNLLAIEEELNALLLDGAEKNAGIVNYQALNNRLKTLKELLQKDSKYLRDTPVNMLTVLQTGFLRPALNQAFRAFTMRSNTRPCSKKWNRGLNDVLSVVVYHREKVEQFIANK